VCGKECKKKHDKLYNFINKKNISTRNNTLARLKRAKKLSIIHCIECNEPFLQKRTYQKFCGRTCSGRYYKREKYKTDPQFRLARIFRSRLNYALKHSGLKKSISMTEYLSCDINTAKLHIEAMFENGMTWDNHGNKGWHVDHIIPLDAFDLTDKEQIKLGCNYKNLQPLWCEDNTAKNKKLDWVKNPNKYPIQTILSTV